MYLTHVGKFLPTNTVSHLNGQYSLLRISLWNHKTQQHALHNDTGTGNVTLYIQMQKYVSLVMLLYCPHSFSKGNLHKAQHMTQFGHCYNCIK